MKDINEFIEFIKSSDASAPMLSSMQESIYNDLENWRFRIQIKLFVTLGLSGILSLALCPQFHVGPFQDFYHVLHRILWHSDLLCGMFCAAVYSGSGLFAVQLFFHPSEKVFLSRHKLRWATLFTGASYGLLMLASSWNFNAMTLNYYYHTSWILVCFLVISTGLGLKDWSLQSHQESFVE